MSVPDDPDSVLKRYQDGPSILERALEGLRDDDLDLSRHQGGWTIRQIVHHVVDGDDIWKTCIKAAMGNEEGEFSFAWYDPQAQDAWTESWAYAQRSIDVSLELLRANRRHILQLLDHVPDAWSRSIGFRNPNGEVERVSVGLVVQMHVDHVDHHVKQIRAIREEHDRV